MKILLVLFTLFSLTDCFGQTVKSNNSSQQSDTSLREVIFFEDFLNNSNNWTVADNKNVSSRIENGFYYLKALGHAYGEAQEVKIDTRKDFEIETRIKIESGNDEHKDYYSMIFWGREAMSGYYFTFAGDGFASVEFCDGKNQRDCIVKSNSLQQTMLNPVGFNIYTIKKIGKTYSFFINGNQFYTMPFAPFYGNLVGFGAGRKVSLVIDYFKISYL